MKQVRLSALIGLILAGCSSAPQAPPEPAWVHQEARTVDGGYIVYVGTGEDRVPERARFKSEAMALQDLANECSFAPKGARVEDHYDEPEGVLHKTYAKVAIEFQDCEAAKRAVTPEEIRTLANAPFADEIKRYQEMIDEPEAEEEAPLEETASTSGSPSSSQYFVVRQQVAFYKSDIILAPATYYPVGSPVYTSPPPALVAASSQISGYETQHPEIRSSNQSFSNQRPNAIAHQPSALRERGASQQRSQAHPPRRSAGPHQGPRKNINGGNRRKKKQHSK